jgi:hypothetical protein
VIARWTFNLFTLISLLLCAGVVVVWADSYRGTRMFETRRADDVLQWTSDGGVAVLYWNYGPDGEFRWQRPEQRWQILGLTYIDGRLVRRKPWAMLIVPYWMPAMLTAVLPVAWIARRFRQQLREERRAAGLCERCGERVDARGSCPKCATSRTGT